MLGEGNREARCSFLVEGFVAEKKHLLLSSLTIPGVRRERSGRGWLSTFSDTSDLVKKKDKILVISKSGRCEE